MHLESFTIKNFRKFRNKDNTIFFVNSSGIKKKDKTVSDESSIAPSSTLVIGKNNSGKTTIAKALDFLKGNKKPKSSEFNFNYLRELFLKYEKTVKADEELLEQALPKLEFSIKIKINFDEHDSDLVNNLYQFVSISSSSEDLVEINIKYEISEEESFRKNLKMILSDDYSSHDKKEVPKLKQKKFYDLIDDEEKTNFKKSYFNSSGAEVKEFSFNKLFNIKEIKANRHLNDKVLSEVYKKIVSSQYKANDEDKKNLKGSIKTINQNIDRVIKPKSEKISEILKEIEPSKHVQVDLSGNITEDVILSSLIKYNFNDDGDYIPEDQFGLGYINLLNIIGEIIHYIDDYEDGSHQNQINLLFIEEPEVFMHPQMQEFFITRIDKAINKALSLAGDHELHCQLIITTHSSHIVNSKIHSSNSFNNINYLTSINGKASAIKLDDDLVAGGNRTTNLETLKFLKKHIKYKVSELFFSDAVIFVEGVTEETLLPYYLELEEDLKNYYVSIFNINGAHTKLYFPLIKALKVPCLVITDLDIKREKIEKGDSKTKDSEYKQITSLKDRTTTNDSLTNLLKGDSLSQINYFEDNNLYAVFQKKSIESQFATSFEEAFILTNYNNQILNNALKKCKPKTYKNIVIKDGKEKYEKLINNSFKLQKKLSSCKTDFANNLLYECITSEVSDKPNLPQYIKDGFEWLKTNLNPQIENVQESVENKDEK